MTMIIELIPISSVFASMLPVMGCSCFGAVVWLYACRYLCKSADIAHMRDVAAAGPDGYIIAVRGTPSDRLWFGSMATVASILLLCVGAYALLRW